MCLQSSSISRSCSKLSACENTTAEIKSLEPLVNWTARRSIERKCEMLSGEMMRTAWHLALYAACSFANASVPAYASADPCERGRLHVDELVSNRITSLTDEGKNSSIAQKIASDLHELDRQRTAGQFSNPPLCVMYSDRPRLDNKKESVFYYPHTREFYVSLRGGFQDETIWYGPIVIPQL